MLEFITGDILESDAQALVNTVNTVGVMGKGIALQFKKAFPNNYIAYRQACEKEEVVIGKLFVGVDSNLQAGEKIIINFPTKKHWRNSSQYSYIERGLDDLIKVIEEYRIKRIAIPPLGSGNGGLNWVRVKEMIKDKLGNLDIEIMVYEPSTHIKERLKKERVKLTPARALLLYVIYDQVKNREYISEFSSEKICYFLQRFGAKKYFKLEFIPYFYGPYSGKVRFLLNILSGSYLMGFNDMDKDPFAPLTLIPDAYNEVQQYVENNPILYEIAQKTTTFLNGFYSDFALEFLSSMDYVANKEKTLDPDVLTEKLSNCSERKSNLLSNPRYMAISLNHLKNTLFA